MTVNYSYHKIIRKIIVAFGDMFNNVTMFRYTEAGEEESRFLVPLLYGGKEKYVSRLEGDPDLDKKVQITLPAMSYEMTNMHYDSARKLVTTNKLYNSTGIDSTTLAVWNPVPFDFDFSLWAYVRNFEDGAQLMEKILPYFTPDYTLSVNLIPEIGIVKKIPLTLKNVTHEVDYEGDYNTNVRRIIWTLNFTVKGYLFGPVSEPKIIRKSFTNVYDDLTMGDRYVKLVMQPGGNGSFKEGETIFQGYSYEFAVATAKVVSWSYQTRELLISNVNGHFMTSRDIIGSDTNAKWTLDSYSFDPVKLVEITIEPNPIDVILPNNYTYTTNITEYLA